MLRKEKRITDRKEIDAIIHASQVCRLAMAHDNEPYLVPLSFGYDGSAIYIHTAAAGRKIDFFLANDRVCFELEHGVQLIPNDDKACKWSYAFECVIGYGIISEVTDSEQKEYGLNQVMEHYSQKQWDFNPQAVAKTRVWKITISALQGKRSGG